MIMADKKYILAVWVLLCALVLSLCVGVYMLPQDNDAEQSNEEPVENTSLLTEKSQDVIRVLAAGRDRASGLYDVIMLVSFDRADKTVSVLQIPRDTYFEYTDKAYKKINGAVSSLGGVREFCNLLGSALGLKIDAYISFDLDTLARVVDAIGGVEIELPEAMRYSDPYQNLYINLPAGKQVLDGKTAEKFVRFRSGYLRGDIGRLDAQKLFMAAFFKKCRYSLTLSDVEGLISVMLPNVKTDLGFFQLLSLASDAMSIDGSSLCFVTAPGEDIVSSVSGAWYYVLSAEGMRRLTSELLGSEDSFDDNGIFLNEKNDDAVRIYRKNIEYKTFIADDINKNGVKID